MHVHNLFKAIFKPWENFGNFFEIFVISIFKQQTVHNKNNNKKNYFLIFYFSAIIRVCIENPIQSLVIDL